MNDLYKQEIIDPGDRASALRPIRRFGCEESPLLDQVRGTRRGRR